MKPAFYEPQSFERPWGIEEFTALVPGVATLKILVMGAGKKGRLQRHHVKDEAGYLWAGELLVRWVENSTLQERVLKAGQSFHFPPGCIHQEEAVTNCLILEVSNPVSNDREGCEDMFGLPVPADALPSTTPEDVTEVGAWW